MELIHKNKYDKFKEILNNYLENDEISHWNINGHTIERENFYIESDYRIESILESLREEFTVTIYKDFEKEIGRASFSSSPQDSKEEFEENLKNSIFVCNNSKTKIYSLAKKDSEEVKDSHIDYDSLYSKKFKENFKSKTLSIFFAQILNKLKEKVSASQTKEVKIKVNSCEFLNSIRTFDYIDSQEISKNYNQNSSYVELILTSINNITKEETEFVTYEKINDIYNFDFDTFFNSCILNAKDSLIAKKMKDFNGEIILKDSACKDFFTPDLTLNSVIGFCFGKLKHQGVSKFEIGDEIVKSKKDKLTVHINAIKENNSMSQGFDSEGISGRKTNIIEENIIKNFITNKQYSNYLNINPTGPMGVVEVNLGKKSLKDLESDKRYVEILTFSWFAPDLVSGDFSCEIRQGYKYENGIKTPIKGGLFTGNIFKILENFELSKEEMDVPGYVGPKAIKFYDAEIVGL